MTAHPKSSALVKTFTDAAHAPSTRRTYEQSVRHFKAHGGKIPATPQSVASYLAQMAGQLAIATLSHRLSAIHHAHLKRGLESPTKDALVQQTMQGIRRTLGVAQRRVLPLVKESIVELLVTVDRQEPMKLARDRALLLIGFASALRRSELVALTVEDISPHANGIELLIRRSKTDQTGQGRTVFVPLANAEERCPVKALEQWLLAAGIGTGAIFRRVNRHDQVVGKRPLSAQGVAMVVKALIRQAKGEEAAKLYAGHSLRAGFATEAASAGMHTSLIMAQTGHKSADMLFRVYIRPTQRRRTPSLL